MRPIKLVMSAFGPYSGRTEVNFEMLGKSGIYLITGDTGAGKTTIFDAITYAFYDSTSGDVKDPSMYRSKYAEDSMTTEVELKFENKGKIYTVKRSPTYDVVKKNGNGMTTKQATAELIYCEEGKPRNTVITKIKDVNNKIKEILGIDRDQFVSIVMIAQGEFQKFLIASTDKKREIFRKIFSTDNYKSLQELIKNDYNTLKSRHDSQNVMLKSCYDRIVCDENDVETVAQLGKARSDGMLWGEVFNLLDTLIKTDKEREICFDKKIKETRNLLKNVRDEITKAETLATSRETLRKCNAELPVAESEEKIAKSIFEDEIRKQPEQNKILTEIAEIKSQYPDYDELEARKTELKDVKHAGIVFAEKKSQQESELGNLDKEIKKLVDEKRGYASATEDKAKLEKDLIETRQRQGELVAMKRENDELLMAQKELQDAQRDYLEKKTKAQTAQDEFVKKNRTYLDAQAGILAQNLSDGEPCPVCGSTSHPHLAIMSEDVLSKEELDVLEQEWRDAGRAEAEASSFSGVKQGVYNGKLETLSESATKLFPGKSIEEALKFLPDEIDALQKKLDSLGKKIKAEDRNLKRCAEIDRLIPEQSDRQNKLKEAIGEISGEIIKCDTQEKSIRQRLEILSQKLSFDSKSLAETKVKTLTEKQSRLAKALDEAQKNYSSKKERVQELNTMKKQAEDALKDAPNTDLEKMRQREDELVDIENKTFKENKVVASRILCNEQVQKDISLYGKGLDEMESEISWKKPLFDTATGQLTGKEKITLEAYAQTAYFDRVLDKANVRLLAMSGGQYELARSEQAEDKRGQAGLDLDVVDYFNGTSRSVKTLSGGESFEASLSLALGLSDEVLSHAGGMELDVMFVDEGFGTLSEDVLELALKALDNLSAGEGGRLVGIISHVTELKNRIEKKIIVTKDRDKGSRIEISTD